MSKACCIYIPQSGSPIEFEFEKSSTDFEGFTNGKLLSYLNKDGYMLAILCKDTVESSDKQNPLGSFIAKYNIYGDCFVVDNLRRLDLGEFKKLLNHIKTM